ncbi:MAG: aminotransferase class V-fold PLP-dependent enzyme [Nitrososphaerales archaeon]
MKLDDYRVEFPIIKRMIYLDHASVSPIPRRVWRAIKNFYRERMLRAELAWERWVEAANEVRKLVAKLINASPEEIALLKNTSEGINVVACGLKWKKGDSIVTTDLEFPSNFYPWLKLRERGVNVRIVKHRDDGTINLDDIAQSIDRTTKLVAISHVQYGNGFRIDLKALRNLTKDKCLLLVDAVQSLGAIPIEAKYADFISAGCHKWLLSPFGISIFYVSKDVELENSYVGWASVENPNAFSSIMNLAKSARRFEIGCLDFSSVYGLRVSLQILLEVGISRIEHRLKKLGDIIFEEVDKFHILTQTPREPSKRAGILNLKFKNNAKIVKKLRKERVIVAERMNGIRISPHFYNNEQDICRFLEVLSRIVKDLN